MSFNRILGLSFLFLLGKNTTAQTATNDTLPNALLWKITGNGLTKPSYLYGTIHIIGADDYFVTPETRAALDSAEEVTFEVDMDKMTNPLRQLSMLRKAVMPKGITLSSLLTTEEYRAVESHFAKQGLNLQSLERIKPLFLSAMATGEGGTLQDGSMKSYEMEFYKIAEDADKKVSGLESMAYQLSMFDSIPYEAQAQMLYQSIKENKQTELQYKRMVRCYKNQDLTCLQREMEDEDGGMGNYTDLMLGQRNRNWIPIMSEQMKKKRSFFAVGAGHLPGPQGVITLLRKAGFTVEPVMNP